ncbi:MAG TPA: hypothetical protein VHR72_01215, partial [Gemmataceae bacterium]|nr:hypothetical protein [Gemmataceae bacterium]
MTLRLLFAAGLFFVAGTAGIGIAVAQTSNEWILRAATARENGEIDKAFAFVDKAIAAEPGAKLGYLFRAALRESHPGTDRIAGLKQALADYTAVLKIDPKDVDALQSRGCVNFQLARFDASVADFDAFLVERPNARKKHWQRGISLYYAG